MPRPHGGKLVNLELPQGEKTRLLEEAEEMPKILVSRELAKVVENISDGVFSPLEGFLNEENYLGVLRDMRLANDLPWTIPILIDVEEEKADDLSEGDDIVLLDEEGLAVAVMHLEEKYSYDKQQLSRRILGTTGREHPGVGKIYSMKDRLLGGNIRPLKRNEDEFSNYRLKPIETRVLFKQRSWNTIVGFQTRNPPHLGHEHMQKTALTFVDGIFINPVLGKKKPGDFKDEVIIAAYEELIRNYYLKENAVLAILETEMWYAGPREAVFHAILRKNFGCTHFIVGRDHAGVGGHYPPYAAQEIFEEFPDLGIVPLFFRSLFYCKDCYGVANEKTCPHDRSRHVRFSGTEIRRRLQRGEKPSRELVRPEVAEIILRWNKPFVEEMEEQGGEQDR
jgi:sulfate adenylyltransferase